MRSFIIVCLMFVGYCSLAQNRISGYILDSATGQPINAANIYWDNTQLGTTANVQGAFSIGIPPEGQLMLVISNVNYNTVIIEFARNKNMDSLLTVKMTAQEKMLESVTVGVGNYTTVNSKKWKTVFSDYFLGNNSYGKECRILNPEKIILRLSRDEKTLKARSLEAIVVENHWLGYKIFYEILECEINLDSRSLVNYGLVRFQDMGANNQADLRRKEMYCGSLTHFFRTFYRNEHLQNGFEVRRALIQKNTEKERIRELVRKNSYQVNYSFETIGSKKVPDDSAKYYYQVYIAKNENSIVTQPKLVTLEELLITDLDIFKEVSFKDYLLVTYKKKAINYMDPNITPEFRFTNPYQNSLVRLADDNSILLYPTGRFSPPRSLLLSGNWANSNAISHLIPQEYECKCD